MSRPRTTWTRAVRLYRADAREAPDRAERGARAVARFRRFAHGFGSEAPEDVTLSVLLAYQRRVASSEIRALLEFFVFLAERDLV